MQNNILRQILLPHTKQEIAEFCIFNGYCLCVVLVLVTAFRMLICDPCLIYRLRDVSTGLAPYLPAQGRIYRLSAIFTGSGRIYRLRVVSTGSALYLPAQGCIYRLRAVYTGLGSYLPAQGCVYRLRVVSIGSGPYLPAHSNFFGNGLGRQL